MAESNDYSVPKVTRSGFLVVHSVADGVNSVSAIRIADIVSLRSGVTSTKPCYVIWMAGSHAREVIAKASIEELFEALESAAPWGPPVERPAVEGGEGREMSEPIDLKARGWEERPGVLCGVSRCNWVHEDMENEYGKLHFEKPTAEHIERLIDKRVAREREELAAFCDKNARHMGDLARESTVPMLRDELLRSAIQYESMAGSIRSRSESKETPDE